MGHCSCFPGLVVVADTSRLQMLGKWEQSFVRIQECDLRLLACDCSCLSHFSIIVLRHHDQGNVEKSLLGADSARGLESMAIRARSMQRAGSCGAGTVAESLCLQVAG